MPFRVKILLVLVVAAMAVVAGMLARQALQPGPEAVPDASVPEYRPAFSMRDIDGDMREISEWDGQVVLLNFWATWCPPCREEIPLLIEAREQLHDQGLEVIGVAADDIDAVRAFARELDIPYPLLVHPATSLEIARAYGEGLGALPYSVLYDRDGRILATHSGEMDRQQLQAFLSDAFDDVLIQHKPD